MPSKNLNSGSDYMSSKASAADWSNPHDYCIRLKKGFESDELAYSVAGNLSIIISLLDAGLIPLNKHAVSEIRTIVYKNLSIVEDKLKSFAMALNLDESADNESIKQRLYFIVLQMLEKGKLIDGLTLDFADVLLKELPQNLNITVKGSKLKLADCALPFLHELKQCMVMHTDEAKRKTEIANVMRKLLRLISSVYP